MSVTLMTRKHKKKLNTNRKNLVANILIDNISSDLLQNEILTNRDLELIKAEVGIGKNEKLLDILEKKSDDNYLKFVKVLNANGHKHLAQLLEPNKSPSCRTTTATKASDDVNQLLSDSGKRTEQVLENNTSPVATSDNKRMYNGSESTTSSVNDTIASKIPRISDETDSLNDQLNLSKATRRYLSLFSAERYPLQEMQREEKRHLEIEQLQEKETKSLINLQIEQLQEKETKSLISLQIEQLQEKETKSLINLQIEHLRLRVLAFRYENARLELIKKDGSLRGHTLLGNDLFVARDRPGELDVYDANDLKFTRNLGFRTQSRSIQAMVSCPRNNLMFVGDANENIVYRYDNGSKHFSKSWSVGGVCSGLSITKSYNLLVTVHNSGKIQEFTSEGELVREIVLDGSIDHPQHCVQLARDRYAVSHEGNELHRVCIVDMNGCIVKSYGDYPGSEVGQLDGPRQITVDEHDCILVADSHNNRVEMLTFELSHLMFVTLPGVTLCRPQTVNFNEQQDRLCIGELDGRLFVLELNKQAEQLEPH